MDEASTHQFVHKINNKSVSHCRVLCVPVVMQGLSGLLEEMMRRALVDDNGNEQER